MKRVIQLLLTAWLLLQSTLPVAAQSAPLDLCKNATTAFPASFSLRDAIYAGQSSVTLPKPFLLGVCAQMLGGLRYGIDDLDGALDAFSVAVDAFNQDGNQELKAIILGNIGEVYHRQGRYEESLAVFQETLAISQKRKDQQAELAAFNNLGNVYYGLGQTTGALNSFNNALAIARDARIRESEMILLNNIGAVYNDQGRYAEALITYQTALSIAQANQDLERKAITLNNISSLYHDQGRYEEALPPLEEVFAIAQEVGNGAMAGTALHNTGAIYEAQGESETALAVFQEALSIRQNEGDRIGEAITMNSIGKLFQTIGDPSEALPYHQGALSIAEETGDMVSKATALHQIGKTYFALGQTADSLPLFQQALILRRETGARTGEGETIKAIGDAYRIQGAYADALDYYEQAMALFESIRVIAGSDTARASFIAQHAPLYDAALDLYIQEGMPADAYRVGVRGRARSFADALATGYVSLSDDEGAALIAAELESYGQVAALSNALSLSPSGSEAAAGLAVQLAEAEAAHDAALTAIAAQNQRLLELLPGRSATLSLLETQALLDDQTTLVSFWVLEERTIAFILTNDSFDAVAIDIDEETLNRQIKAFHDALNDKFADNAAYPDTAVLLYNSLIAPLRSRLNTFHLIIVPHQGLHYLPFAALTDGKRSLMDDFNITYLPNAGMLQFLPGDAETTSLDDILVLGNPTTELRALPGAAQEAQTIAAMFGVEPYLADAATEVIIRQEVAAADILHLGAHASYDNAAPLDSTIHLATNDDSIAEDDGKLYAREVYGLPLQETELVVLSACQTNIGNLDVESGNEVSNVSAGDEIISLNRAFLFYAPTVVSTLWTVDDDATGLLMERFYTHLLDGKSKADALRLAQLYVRDYGNGKYADPYNWAGFVLSGDGGEVDFSAMPTASTTGDTTTAISETETSVPQTTESQKTGGNGIYLGAALLLALVALAIVARKKLINGRDEKA